MKCHAEKKLATDRLNEVYKAVGKTILSYLDVSSGCVINDFCGHARKRLQAMYNGTKENLDEMIDFYGADGDDSRERTETSLVAMRRELQQCGFDFISATESLRVDDPFLKFWHTQRERDKHQRRVDFVNDMELLAQAYHASILVWFRREHDYGAFRLLTLYKALREDYNLVIAEYLRCTTAGDMKIETTIQERQDKLTKIGLTLMEV